MMRGTRKSGIGKEGKELGGRTSWERKEIERKKMRCDMVQQKQIGWLMLEGQGRVVFYKLAKSRI